MRAPAPCSAAVGSIGPGAYLGPLAVFGPPLPIYLEAAFAEANAVIRSWDEGMRAAGVANALFPPGSTVALAAQLSAAVVDVQLALKAEAEAVQARRPCNAAATAARAATTVALLWFSLRERLNAHQEEPAGGAGEAQDELPFGEWAAAQEERATRALAELARTASRRMTRDEACAWLESNGFDRMPRRAFLERIWPKSVPESWRRAGRKTHRAA